MSLKSQTVSGIKWNTIATVNNACAQLLKLSVLARILGKTDFGIIAIALMIIGLMDIFANLGLATGIIHKQNISKKQYSSVFWLNLIASIIIYIVLCATTPLLSNFYNEPILKSIIPILGLQLIITAFGKMFYTFKTKELEFKFISIVNIIGVIISTVATIIMALMDFGVYSLVFGILLQNIIIQTTFILSGLHKYKILFYFKLKDIKDIIKIGGFQVGSQITDYLASQLDIFLIGRFFGMEMLGIYNLAKEILLKIIQAINPIITNVATPAFAKIQNNMESIQKNYLKILNILSSINFPVFIAFFVFAEPITILIYGQNMIEIASFIKILSFWGLLNSIGNPCGILMVSLGRTDLGFYWTLTRIFFTTIAILISCNISIQAVAYSQTIIAFTFFFIYWRMMIYTMTKISLKDYIYANLPALATSALAMIIPCTIFLFVSNLPLQISLIVLYFVLYILFNLIFNKKYVKEILKIIK